MIVFNNAKVFENINIGFLFAFFLLKPIYLFSSGLPQIADLLLVLLVIVNIFYDNKMLKGINKHKKIAFLFTLFVSYIIVVNGVWTIVTGTPMIMPSLWYIYNVLAVFVVFALYYTFGDRLYYIIFNSVVISLGLQACLVFFTISQGSRLTLFFNNPNQLGYYAVLSLAIIMLIAQKIDVNGKMFLGGIIFSLILVTVSFSNAAIISSLAMLIVYLFIKKRNKQLNKIGLFFICVFSIGFLVYFFNPGIINKVPILNGISNRMESAVEIGAGQLQYRRYDIIYNYSQYLVLGAGEGNTRSRVGSGEIHSTFGSILFSYGLVGLSLFMLIIFTMIHRQKFYTYYPVLFPFLYGFVHNGTRSTFLWILFGLIITGINDTFQGRGRR